MTVLQRLLQEDFNEWELLVKDYENRNRSLKVPSENNTSTLHEFNVALNQLYTEVEYDFARARRNKDAMENFIEGVLKDWYKGQNEHARKAAGLQLARSYPTDGLYDYPTIDLFELKDRFNWYFLALEATIKTLRAKADAKITSNSILSIERSLTP